MVYKDWKDIGRKYCLSCKKDVITKCGVGGKLWCVECNELISC